jgi:spore maturation protein CgeB
MISNENSLRILVVGSAEVWAIENYYVKYLREEGVQVSHFSAQTIFYAYYQKNIFNKLIFKAGLSGIYNKINKEFKQQVEYFKPTVILIFKGMEIFPESLQWVKEKGIKLINYNPDNPFIFSGKGSGNANLKSSITLYDLHLTYNSAVKIEMEKVYNIPTEILPFGFEISDELLERCFLENEIVKACFLGNPDKYRGDFLTHLAEQGIELDIYGNDWHKFVSHPNIKIFEPIYGEAFWLALRKYRVQLNLMRPHNPDSHNMRSFEVPGVGGILLAPATPDHQMYFEPNCEIFLYTDIEESITQIKKILALSVNDANAIRMRARQYSILSGYTYKDRSKQLLQQIHKLYK